MTNPPLRTITTGSHLILLVTWKLAIKNSPLRMKTFKDRFRLFNLPTLSTSSRSDLGPKLRPTSLLNLLNKHKTYRQRKSLKTSQTQIKIRSTPLIWRYCTKTCVRKNPVNCPLSIYPNRTKNASLTYQSS